jgi:hypothetical protein
MFKRILLIACITILLGLMITGCTIDSKNDGPGQVTVGTIHGTTYTSSGTLGGVKVYEVDSFGNQGVYVWSGANGEFSLFGLPEGTNTVRFEKAGYYQHSIEVYVEAGRVTELTETQTTLIMEP